MRSIKFLQADGGWNRVVWMPKEIQDRIKEYMPPEIIPKIATEKDVTDLDGLKKWLKEKDHPIIKTWKEAPAQPKAEAVAVPKKGPVAPLLELPPRAGGLHVAISFVGPTMTVMHLCPRRGDGQFLADLGEGEIGIEEIRI